VRIELTAVGADARETWRQVVALDPGALVSQTPQWMDCVCASGRYEDATRAYAGNGGPRLILPLARLRLPAAPDVMMSMPFGWGNGGLITSASQVTAGQVAAVAADLARQRALLIGVRPAPSTASAWAGAVPEDAVRTRHMSQTIDLSRGFGAVWNGFAESVRRHCRQAERRGIVAQRDDTGRLVPVFDALYRKSVERWARQQNEPLWLARWRAARRDPSKKFQTVAERLGSDCRVWVGSCAGEPVAAMVVLTHGENSTMWRAAMDKTAAKGTGANELLHRLAIEEACEAGHRFFHLGDSAPASGLARNKRGFGAQETDYTAYHFERGPLIAADRFVRREVKRVIGFRD
jgi:Acetyltransferase (GNAT) domain